MLRGCSWVRAHERVRDRRHCALRRERRLPHSRRPDYLSPGAWDALDAPEGTFTLAAGDILVRGAVEDEITENFSAAALLKKYERAGAMVVQSAKENTALSALRTTWRALPGAAPCSAATGPKRAGEGKPCDSPSFSGGVETAKHRKKLQKRRILDAAAREWHKLYAPYVPMDTGPPFARRALWPGNHRAPRALRPAASTTARGWISAATSIRWPSPAGTGPRKRR